jgi:predicted CoA-binding protein
MKERITLVLGATEKTDRYANMAIRRLLAADEKVIAVGNKNGNVEGVPILTEIPEDIDIHTVTLYVSARNQEPYIEAIVAAKPERVIVNPGTENPQLYTRLQAANIPYELACTLVMLGTNTY